MNEPSWTNKFCPLFTMMKVLAAAQADIAVEEAERESKRIISGGGVPALVRKRSPEASACQGPSCMWFVPQVGPDGKLTGEGTCAVALAPLAIDQLVAVHGAIAHKFIGPDGMATQKPPSTPA